MKTAKNKNKVYTYLYTPVITSFIMFFLFISISEAQVIVTERVTKIPTYEVKQADPNPIFYNGRRYQGAQGRVYPYPLLHNLTNNKIDKEYQEVILENDFVKISILPELGGRLNYARDKVNDYNFLYHNEVVKPALIGMTGAWISGGVEWNIPHHHRATSFMDVDYTITEQEDGSKTVWVGETEWRHRTRWVVGITLHPESTLLETTIKVFNTTPFQNSLLIFANAAVHANEDYQVFFPPETQWATYHRKNQFSEWPISHQFFDGWDYSDGVDVSLWKNHAKPTSFFEWGNMGNFVAGIDHGKEAGTVIFGDKHINPGKKLWSWGNNPNGAMWDDLLTDENGPYIELMFGSYSDNQPDYSWMQTLEVKEATYWFAPIKGLNNVKKVNNDVVVAFDGDREYLHLGVNANRIINNAIIQVLYDDEILFQEQTGLHPNIPYVQTISNDGSYEIHDLSLVIRENSGWPILTYSPVEIEEKPMPDPISSPKSADEINNADSLYYEGLQFEQFHDAFYHPRVFYKKAIELNPQHFSALLRTGILYLKDGDYETATDFLERAVERVAWDYVTPERADPLYYLALAYKEMGNREEAYALLYKASWNYNFHTPAHYQMALMKSQDGDYERALRHLEEAYKTNIRSVDVLSLKASLYRLTGQINKAEHIMNTLIDTDPLNFYGYYEKYLLTNDPGNRYHLVGLMREERENYLELAVKFGNAGLYDEALDLLGYAANSDDERLNSYPVIYYYLGYYHHLLGNPDQAEEYFLAAGSKPHEYVFPFRFETAKALNTALEYNPEDGFAWYYIGNLYYDFQPERAIDSWENAVALNDNIPVAHRNLAFAYANVKNDMDATLENISRALELNPEDPRFYYENDLYLRTKLADPEERLIPFVNNHDVVTSDLTSLFPYVELLTLTDNYSEAIDLMSSYHFRRWEGGEGVYQNWIYAHVNKAIEAMENHSLTDMEELLNASVAYPENLQTVSNQYENISFYYLGILEELRGNTDKAASYFERAASASGNGPENRYFAAKAYEKLNDQTRANEIYQSLIQRGERTLERELEMDFFNPFSTVTSGNDLLAEGHFLLALGHSGLGNEHRAAVNFDHALEYNPAILSLVFK